MSEIAINEKMPSEEIRTKAKMPKNVTEKPRNKEEMHLKLIKNILENYTKKIFFMQQF